VSFCTVCAFSVFARRARTFRPAFRFVSSSACICTFVFLTNVSFLTRYRHIMCCAFTLFHFSLPCQFLLGCERRGAFVPATASYYKRYHAAYCGIIGLMPVTFDAPDDDGLVADHRRPTAAFASAAGAVTGPSQNQNQSQAISSASDLAYLTFATATPDAVISQLPSVHRSRRSLQDMADYFL
jgi:hypothetical protein